MLLTYFLKLPPVKYLLCDLSVVLGTGRTFSSSHNNNDLMPLHSVYTLRYDNSFMLNLHSRQTKADKADNEEIDTDICSNDAVGLFQEGYSSKLHDTILHHLVDIIANSLKRNMARSFVHYMVDNYCPSSSVCHGDSIK